MVTVSEKAGKEGSLPAVPQEAESITGTGACARRSLPLPSSTALAPVTERARTAAGVAVSLGAKAAELADRPGSLIHAHPPTFARAAELHHLAADRHSAPLLRALRLVWGYAHMVLVKSVLNALEWVTETPLRVLGALVLILIIWLWS
jgi:hypothetical protein